MTLVKRKDSLHDLLSMRSAFDRMFDDFFPARSCDHDSATSIWRWTPLVDIFEKDNEIVIKTELPGMKQDDIEVNVENNILTISGERKQEDEVKKENYHRVERFYGSFQRSFTLPSIARTDAIVAEYSDGVLTLHVPKAEEAKPRKIPVSTN